MRLISSSNPNDVLTSLESILNGKQLPDKRLLESLRENPRYKSFLEVGTPIDVNAVISLPSKKEKFLVFLKYHCFLRKQDASSSLILTKIEELLNPDYDQQRILPLLFNNLNEARIFFLETNKWSETSLLSEAQEYLRKIDKISAYYAVRYKHSNPLKVPQRKRGYNDKGNSPDPRKSIAGYNYQIGPSPEDIQAQLEKTERINSYVDTIHFIQGMMY